MDENPQRIVGHMTMSDGSHRPLTAEMGQRMMEAAERAEAKRAADMPDEKAALTALGQAVRRLKELGWSDAIYCPKDGSVFHAIEAGSTGIHDCYYHGEWPTGSWRVLSDGDEWPSRPILYRLKPPTLPIGEG